MWQFAQRVVDIADGQFFSGKGSDAGRLVQYIGNHIAVRHDTAHERHNELPPVQPGHFEVVSGPSYVLVAAALIVGQRLYR